MKQLLICLFGRLQVRYGPDQPIDLKPGKVRELLCYLALHRDQPQSREILASRLWGDHCTTSQSRKYLRHALWQLQVTLNRYPDLRESGLLLVEPEWIRLRTFDCLWIDVAAFEATYASVRGVSGRDFDSETAEALEAALNLYSGDLLANWYAEWCLCDRERLLHIYLIMLDKLIDYHERRGNYEVGLSYGERILRYDRAREHTHRQMMRLYYLSGDRTSALRQYERCAEALEEELDVAPSYDTRRLFERMRVDRMPVASEPHPGTYPAGMREVLASLERLHTGLADVERKVRRAIAAADGVSFAASRSPDEQLPPMSKEGG